MNLGAPSRAGSMHNRGYEGCRKCKEGLKHSKKGESPYMKQGSSRNMHPGVTVVSSSNGCLSNTLNC